MFTAISVPILVFTSCRCRQWLAWDENIKRAVSNINWPWGRKNKKRLLSIHWFYIIRYVVLYLSRDIIEGKMKNAIFVAKLSTIYFGTGKHFIETVKPLINSTELSASSLRFKLKVLTENTFLVKPLRVLSFEECLQFYDQYMCG